MSWRTAERLLDAIAIAIGVGCLLASLPAHMKLVAYPGPQELNEPAAWYATELLSQGRNPFVASELPGSAQFFGPFYSYVVMALRPVVGDGYSGHRLVNLYCIAGSLWLLGAAMRRLGANWGVIFTSLSVLYWIVLDNIMITARPDALGWALFLACVLIPAARGYSIRSCAVGLACGVLAFQCKAYFALAGCATLLGLGALHSWRAALWCGFGYFSLVTISVGVTTWYFPLYFMESFVMQQSMVAGNSSDQMSRVHTLLFLKRAWPFLLIIVSGAAVWSWRAGLQRWRERSPDENSFVHRLIPRSVVEVLAAVLLVHLALVYFYMGRNGGAWFTYHIHLLFPFLFLMTAVAVRHRVIRVVATVLLAGFAVTSLQVRWAPTDATAYRRLSDLIRDEPGEVFGLAAAVEPLSHHTKHIYEDGFTTFLGFALSEGRSERFLASRLIEERCRARDEELVAKVQSRSFGLILTEESNSLFCDIELIKANYRVVEAFQMPSYFGHGAVWVWRPKPRGE